MKNKFYILIMLLSVVSCGQYYNTVPPPSAVFPDALSTYFVSRSDIQYAAEVLSFTEKASEYIFAKEEDRAAINDKYFRYYYIDDKGENNWVFRNLNGSYYDISYKGAFNVNGSAWEVSYFIAEDKSVNSTIDFSGDSMCKVSISRHFGGYYHNEYFSMAIMNVEMKSTENEYKINGNCSIKEKEGFGYTHNVNYTNCIVGHPKYLPLNFHLLSGDMNIGIRENDGEAVVSIKESTKDKNDYIIDIQYNDRTESFEFPYSYDDTYGY